MHSWFTHETWWFSIVMLVYQRVTTLASRRWFPDTKPVIEYWMICHFCVILSHFWTFSGLLFKIESIEHDRTNKLWDHWNPGCGWITSDLPRNGAKLGWNRKEGPRGVALVAALTWRGAVSFCWFLEWLFSRTCFFVNHWNMNDWKFPNFYGVQTWWKNHNVS